MVQGTPNVIATIQFVHGYNFAFCADRALLPPLPDNYQTLMELFEVIVLFALSFLCNGQLIEYFLAGFPRLLCFLSL